MSVLANQRLRYGLSWPPVLVLLIILVAGQLLAGRYRFIAPPIVILLLVYAAALTTYVVFLENRSRFDRAILVTAVLVASVMLVETFGLVRLLALLFSGSPEIRGSQLLASGAYYWSSNVLTFGLWFWLIDRGGPHMRLQRIQQRADFFFPEMAAGEQTDPQFSPKLAEYMYLAFTNATAFSPTDTLPLSTRARALMTLESAMSLITIALVMARAVNILK